MILIFCGPESPHLRRYLRYNPVIPDNQVWRLGWTLGLASQPSQSSSSLYTS
jgi:hypothetical protein